MSINDPYDRAYRREGDSRTKINNLTWGSPKISQKVHCPLCLEHWKLAIKDTPNGKVGTCIRGCGKDYPLEVVQNEEQSGKRYVARFGTASGKQNTFIISQKKKTLKPGELDAEDRADLAALGASGAGATLIDSRETYTDSQGGTY